MKRTALHVALMLGAFSLCLQGAVAGDMTTGMKEGKVQLKSAGPVAFGPEGILFVADTKAAAIVAIATGDVTPAAGDKLLKVDGINQKIAALVGSSAEQIQINDMAVNPISHFAYLAVSRGRGPGAVPVIIRVKPDDQVEAVSLEDVKFSRAELPDAPTDGVVGEGNRQSNPRQESITDLAFFEDRVLVAGLCNEEFSSTLRAIPFPFKTVENGTGVEIYHGSHGRFETRAPVRTFVPMNIGTEPTVLAAYTCTPLVQFPMKDLKPGAKVKGKTVAELGNRNRPLDMITYQKDGKDYLLLANSSRGVMKVNIDRIDRADPITSPVRGGQKGLPIEAVQDWTGVDHLEKLDAGHAVVIRRGEGKAMNLESLALP